MTTAQETWGTKHLKDGIKIVQSRTIPAVENGVQGFKTVVSITGADGTEQSGFITLPDTFSSHGIDDSQAKANNAFRDTPYEAPQQQEPNTPIIINKADGSHDREASFLANQAEQNIVADSDSGDSDGE